MQKFKPNYIVEDRELKRKYVIERFIYRQLNESNWYTAFDLETKEKVWLCEDWLNLIKIYSPIKSRG